MKIKIEYDLDNPDTNDNWEFKKAMQAGDLWCALWDITTGDINKWWKHGSDFKDVGECLDAVKEYITDVLAEYNINIYEE